MVGRHRILQWVRPRPDWLDVRRVDFPHDEATNFRASKSLLDDLLAEDLERKRPLG
jgi:hypothetical protein